MRKIAFLTVLLALPMTAHAEGMMIKNAHMHETMASMPAGAIFMTIENHTQSDDKLTDFKIAADLVERTELHTMTHEDEIMKMRKVDGYAVAAGETHELGHGGDHVMVYGFQKDMMAGNEFNAVAVFAEAGEVPVTVKVKDRNDKVLHKHHDHHDHHGHHHHH